MTSGRVVANNSFPRSALVEELRCGRLRSKRWWGVCRGLLHQVGPAGTLLGIDRATSEIAAGARSIGGSFHHSIQHPIVNHLCGIGAGIQQDGSATALRLLDCPLPGDGIDRQ